MPALRRDGPATFPPESLRDLVHVQPRFHDLLLVQISDGDVFVADDQSDLTLIGLPPHTTAEAPQFAKLGFVFDVGGRRVAMRDHWFVEHQGATSIVIPPNTL